MSKVTLLGNPILRQKCRCVSDVQSSDVKETVRELEDTLNEARCELGFGRGIAAPQVGSTLRIVHINVDEPMFLLNPKITHKSEQTFEVWDDCLSLPSLLVRVQRHCDITIEFMNLNGENQTLNVSGDMSELLQHEIDHLDGLLILDRATGDNPVYIKREWKRQFGCIYPE